MGDGVGDHVVEVVEGLGNMDGNGGMWFTERGCHGRQLTRALRLVGMSSVRMAMPPSSRAPRKRSRFGWLTLATISISRLN